jgi:cell division protein FtsB
MSSKIKEIAVDTALSENNSEEDIEQKEEIKYLSDEVWDLEEEVATLKKNNLQLSKKLETKENQ